MANFGYEWLGIVKNLLTLSWMFVWSPTVQTKSNIVTTMLGIDKNAHKAIASKRIFTRIGRQEDPVVPAIFVPISPFRFRFRFRFRFLFRFLRQNLRKTRQIRRLRRP